MDATSAIRQMLATSGMSARAASTTMGRADTFIKVILRRNSSPRVDTLATIADVCGYDLILLPRNKDASFIVIDSKEDNG